MAGEQRLAGARGAHQQHALGDAAAELLELLRVLEELDDLLELVLGLVDARDVGEGDLVLRLVEQARAATCRSSSPCRRPPGSGA
jgi:hypothetical protein